jgi:hypothetical protein
MMLILLFIIPMLATAWTSIAKIASFLLILAHPGLPPGAGSKNRSGSYFQAR